MPAFQKPKKSSGDLCSFFGIYELASSVVPRISKHMMIVDRSGHGRRQKVRSDQWTRQGEEVLGHVVIQGMKFLQRSPSPWPMPSMAKRTDGRMHETGRPDPRPASSQLGDACIQSCRCQCKLRMAATVQSMHWQVRASRKLS